MIIGISGKIGSGKDLAGQIINYLSTVDNPTAKDFEENYLYGGKELVDPHWEIKKYADKLKDIVCLLIGCTREDLEDREFKEKELGEEWWFYGAYQHGIASDQLTSIHNTKLEAGYILQYSHMNTVQLIKLTPRKILQLLGTEAGREIIHPNIWVNALMSGYKPKKYICNDPYNGDPDVEVPPIMEELIYPNWVITDMRFPNELSTIKDKGGITIRVNRGSGNTGNHPSETALDSAKFDYVIDNNSTIQALIFKLQKILIENKLI